MTTSPIAGILIVDKPWGWTSHDVVGLVRRLSGQRQVGHAGTLDPRATGVLLVTLGAATRLSDYLMQTRKCYLARVRLGVRTSTDDGEGQIICTGPTDTVTRARVVAALAGFRGEIQQTPPAFSAIKRAGVPAYKQARRGQAPDLAPRQVRIDGLALVAMDGNVFDLLVWCGPGTYIRSLARDLGEALGCGAHLAALRRLSSGSFSVDVAIGVQDLRRLADEGRLGERIRPLDVAVASWPALVLDDAGAQAVAHGSPLPWRVGGGTAPGDARPVRLYASDGRLLALARYEQRGHGWQPFKVLV